MDVPSSTIGSDPAPHPAPGVQVRDGSGWPTLVDYLAQRIVGQPDRVALVAKTDGVWRGTSWREVGRIVDEIAGGLLDRGVERGDRIALLSENRPEWVCADLGILSVGAASVPIYATNTPAQIAFILRNAGVRTAFVSSVAQMEKILEIRSQVPDLTRVVVFDHVPEDARPRGVIDLDAFRSIGRTLLETRSALLTERRAAVDPEDLASVIYTSGTTGDPKGVMLLHRNFTSNVEALVVSVPLQQDDTILSFLPLSHVFERTAGYYLALRVGGTIHYAEAVEKVPDNLLEVRPTVMCAVPRLYEKMHARIMQTVAAAPPGRQRIFAWALRVGAAFREATRTGRPGVGLLIQHFVADWLVFRKIRSRTGGRLRFFVSGGAPLSRSIAEFFDHVGVTILEGYGLTETSPVLTANMPGAHRIGTVGRPLPGVEVRIAEDGEILARGPNIMKGYLGRDEDTRAVLTDEGWFHTGDVGEFDPDGFLRITDRKKDLIVTSGGKNVAPQLIENLLKADPYIQEVVVCGDNRNYLTALIVPDFEQLARYATEHAIPHYDLPDLAEAPRIHDLIEGRIKELSRNLARFEQIKKFKLLNHEFRQEEGELTPTLKVKRRVIYQRYQQFIDQMYDDIHAAGRERISEIPAESRPLAAVIDSARRPRTRETIPDMFARAAEIYTRRPALKVRDRYHFRTVSFRRLQRLVREFGNGLIDFGVRPGDRVAIVSDNRFEWILSDLAILGIGAADVPRGADSLPQEIAYILRHAECRYAIVENAALLAKLLSVRAQIPSLERVIVMDEHYQDEGHTDVVSFDEILRRGRREIERGSLAWSEHADRVAPDDVATIIYTSGTTARPKGVVLSHANIMHNVRVLPPLVGCTEGDRWLSILPPWHVFERTVEYATLSIGASIAYSRPVRQVLLKDLALERPMYMACVPRVLEGIHDGIWKQVRKEPLLKQRLFDLAIFIAKRHLTARWRIEDRLPRFGPENRVWRALTMAKARLVLALTETLYGSLDTEVFARIREGTGGSLRAIISGGGALPQHLDLFFQAVGIPLCEGYGLTETAPVVCVRPAKDATPFTVGCPIPDTEIRIEDELGREVPAGTKGIVKIRGPQVMKGYYRDPEATARVMSEDGWFDSGDLGRVTVKGELQLTGRAKDTIVLRSGENVEPEPIEIKLRESGLVNQVMVVGQDRKSLGALVVPDFERLAKTVQSGTRHPLSPREMARHPAAMEAIRREFRRLLTEENGFKNWEQVTRVHLLPAEFKPGEEMTYTLKMKRNVIAERYRREIEAVYADDRPES